MSEPVLHDTVTLLHFAVVEQLGLLEVRHAHRSEPRWTDAVRSETVEGARHGAAGCSQILACGWIGPPAEPTVSEIQEILNIQIGLNDGHRPPTAHLGEAESIYFAEKENGLFVTDDNAAYDFACRRQGLGYGRVKDTVRVLQEAVAEGDISASTASQITEAIRQAGRSLRRVHPDPMTASDFA